MSSPAIALARQVQRETNTGAEPLQRQQDIANLAYDLWQQRGCPEGSANEDWIEAEGKLLGEQSATLTSR